jgi:Flp pilus assembly protein TadG
LKLNGGHSPAGRPRSRGQALVEFGLVFPLFVLLVAGMIDFGIGLYSYMTIINAARDGARLAATACEGTACSGAVGARVTASAGGLAPTVTVTCSPGLLDCSDAKKGDIVTVTASYTYKMIWPLTFGTQIPMSSSVTFMVE